MTSAAAAAEEEKASGLRNLVEWVVILGGALVVAFVVKTFLIQAFFIPSPSMVPTLEVHDRVLVNKLSYRLHPVHRGDIVVFERPPGESASDIKDLIKRVVAVGGDTIESKGDTLYVNDKPISEPYRASSADGPAVPRQTIAAGNLFVMGDNRTNSSDSRVFGQIRASSVVGRAFVKVWPVTSFELL